MRPLRLLLLVMITVCVLAMLAVLRVPSPQPSPVPAGALNHLAHQLADQWRAPDGSPAQPDPAVVERIVTGALEGSGEDRSTTLPAGTGVAVVDAGGDLLHVVDPDPRDPAAEDWPVTTPRAAIASRALTQPILAEDGTVLGAVYVTDPGAQAGVREGLGQVRAAALAGIAAATLTSLTALAVLHRRVVRPFRRLEVFAQDVAAGRLDAPLDMDRGNVFGAWTESFDLMRTELAAARRAEAQAREDMRTTVAQLSHDVRTPVASIATTVEVLQLGRHDAATEDRLRVIARKAAQIDQLAGDLFVANRDQLASLPVAVSPVATSEVVEMIRLSDTEQRVRLGAMPEALVLIDARRMQQVLDNVIGNAYKHAGTGIDVHAEVHQGLWHLEIADRGPGVDADELGVIFGRGVRGSGVGEVPGSGLGLHSAAHLMERMGGGIAARARTGGGLVIDLDVALV